MKSDLIPTSFDTYKGTHNLKYQYNIIEIHVQKKFQPSYNKNYKVGHTPSQDQGRPAQPLNLISLPSGLKREVRV